LDDDDRQALSPDELRKSGVKLIGGGCLKPQLETPRRPIFDKAGFDGFRILKHDVRSWTASWAGISELRDVLEELCSASVSSFEMIVNEQQGGGIGKVALFESGIFDVAAPILVTERQNPADRGKGNFGS
jgi:hypothetical protein